MTGCSQSAARRTHSCKARVLLFLISISSTFLLGLVFAGCGSHGGASSGAGGGAAYVGYDCLSGTYCYTDSGTTDTTSTTTTTVTTGGVTGCSDSADASCSGYDPVSTDGGGSGSSDCGASCDSGSSGDNGGGDSGGSGDSGGDSGGGGDDTGDGG
jgi:hypothetical protein